ncbi:neuronal membrane glycoprotein M6-b-like [Neosynchiropus ocellatus]
MDRSKATMQTNAPMRDQEQEEGGCCDCCIKCLGGLPYASLLATILCLTGLALLCTCGHIALTNSLALVETHFSTDKDDHTSLTKTIDICLYCIYGIAAFFFVYSILLLSEGFYTTRAIKKELQSDFKTTFFGRCITVLFVFLSYVLALAFIGIFGFTSIPYFLFYNMQRSCDAISNGVLADVANICVDARQYGVIPWKATPGKVCGMPLVQVCSSTPFYLSYHLYIVALAGTAATAISLIHYLMILSANWAYLKSAAAMHAYQDIKTKDDQDVEAEARSKEGQNSSYS